MKGCTAVAVHRHFAVRRGTSKVQSILMRSPCQRIHRGLFTVHVFAYLCVHNVVEELRDSGVCSCNRSCPNLVVFKRVNRTPLLRGIFPIDYDGAVVRARRKQCTELRVRPRNLPHRPRVAVKLRVAISECYQSQFTTKCQLHLIHTI